MGDNTPTALLDTLEQTRAEYGGEAAGRKLELLRALARRRLPAAAAVQVLHETLCFLRAYPDDPKVLSQVESMLAAFERRGDLRRHRSELADTGIAGTTIHFAFYWETVRWLVKRWPDRLHIDWSAFDNRDRLAGLLHLLLPYCETPALDELDFAPREWLERLKGPDETDAAFLVKRFDALRTDTFGRETTWDGLDVPMRLDGGPGGPSRSTARYDKLPMAYQRGPLSRARPDLQEEIRRPPVEVRAVDAPEGRRLIELAREAMVTRARDLDSFANADPNDVRLVDCGGGLQFACYGARPERRLLLESCYGYLTLKNGVPIGYVLSSSLFGSSAIAYNVFDTFRGAEAAPVFGRVLGMVGHLFGADTFSIDPFQLGFGNKEGLKSGAWWFYYKLGFRPENPDIRKVLRRELAAMKRNRKHRSDVRTLSALASDNVYLYPGAPRDDVVGKVSFGNVGLNISARLAGRFGGARERGIATCIKEVRKLLGVRATGRTRGERLAWERWAPLVLILPGIERWPAADKRRLAAVIRAKGARRESDFVKLFDDHKRLRRAVLRLAAD